MKTRISKSKCSPSASSPTAREDTDLSTQVVILGAGFDTRAYRIAGIEKTRVFEIDHPATQQEKLKWLKKAIVPLPGHVTFVPVDFDTQTLAEHLPASGHNEQGKTLFIWQGVTVYPTSDGVYSTLAFIAHHSGPGSAVIFDYFYTETLRDTSRSEVKPMQRAAQVTGEGYLFGIGQDQIEPFLTRRGFRDIRNHRSHSSCATGVKEIHSLPVEALRQNHRTQTACGLSRNQGWAHENRARGIPAPRIVTRSWMDSTSW